MHVLAQAGCTYQFYKGTQCFNIYSYTVVSLIYAYTCYF